MTYDLVRYIYLFFSLYSRRALFSIVSSHSLKRELVKPGMQRPDSDSFHIGLQNNFPGKYSQFLLESTKTIRTAEPLALHLATSLKYLL